MLTAARGRRPRPGDERASVAMVVLVLFVLASLATLMVTRDIDDARSARDIQNRAVHVAAADVAVAEVVTMLVDGRTPQPGLRGSIGEIDWSAKADAARDDVWELDVETVLDGSVRTVGVTLVDHPLDGWTVERWHEGRAG